MNKSQEEKYQQILRTKKFWRLVDDGVIKYERWWSERSSDDYARMFDNLQALTNSTRLKFDDKVVGFIRAMVMGADAMMKPLKILGSTLADKLEAYNKEVPVEEEAQNKLNKIVQRNNKKGKLMAKKKKKKLSPEDVQNLAKNNAIAKQRAATQVMKQAASKKKARQQVNKIRNQLITKHSGDSSKQIGRTIAGSILGIPGMVASTLHNAADVKNYNKDWKDMRNKIKEIKTKQNDENWYTDLGLHTEFNIPDGWSDNVALPITGKNGLPLKNDITILKMVYNPNSDVNAITQRLFQKMTLLKAVRGLSNVEYNTNDLWHKENATTWFINEYYACLAAVKAAKLYKVNKSRWPLPFVNAKGFTYNDILDNLADIEAFLVNFARFISTVPVSGHIKEKLEFLNLSIIPDTDDYTTASYYAYDVIVDPSTVVLDPEYDATNTLTSVSTANSYSQRNNIATWINNMEAAMATFQQSRRYQLIMSDEIGAYGQSCLFTPSIDMSPTAISAYNVKTLGQIQNTSVCNFEGNVLIEDSAVVISSPLTPGNVDITPDTPGTYVVNPIVNTTNYSDWVTKGTIVRTCTNGQYASGVIYGAIPPLPGFKGTDSADIINTTSKNFSRTANPSYFWDQDVINKYEYKGSEGSLLELINHRASLKYIYLTAGSGQGDVTFHQYYDTFAFACYDIISYSIDNANNYLTRHVVNRVTCTCDYFTGSTFCTRLHDLRNDNVDLASQMDYHPLINNVYFGYAAAKGDTDITKPDVLFDWNIVAIMGRASFLNAKKYIAYSLNAIGYTSEGKKIDNIRDVYNNRA